MSSGLLSAEQAFYSGDYTAVMTADASTDIRVKQLQIRALVAQGETQQALARCEGETSPVFKALEAYASKSVTEADEVLAGADSNVATRHVVALTHAASGDVTGALELIQLAEGSLDASLLQIYLLLALNRDQEAQRVVDATRRWANDHIVFNVGEALTSLRFPESAQKAYFIFEENNSLHPSATSSLGEAVANTELQRFPEASESMETALADGESEATIVSALALALIRGDLNGAAELRGKLQLAKYKDNEFVTQIKEKEEAFARITAKFSA